MNPYGAPPAGARPAGGIPPPYYQGGQAGAPPPLTAPQPLPGPPQARPSFTPLSFPQPSQTAKPAPAAQPALAPTPPKLAPPPTLAPPGQASVLSAPASTAAGKPVLALAKAEPPKKLIATISHIAPSVDNDFMEKLLGVFGAVSYWKRPVDPSTKALKTFGFVEYETPESMMIALRVLQNLGVDGQEIKIKPSTPTATYMEWWETYGRKQKPTEAKEDGEAHVDDDTREMEATEGVMDLVSQREGRGGGRGGRGGSAADTDALISGVAKDMRNARAQERQNRLEHEFEADRSRKEQMSEAERRRERREVDDLIRQVRHMENNALRDRKGRTDRLRSMREKRQQRLQEDNDSSRRDDDDDIARRTDVRPERLKEIEADEKDRMQELEEAAHAREATAARLGHGDAAAQGPADNGSNGATAAAPAVSRGITDLNDNIMKAMLQQVSTPESSGAAAGGGGGVGTGAVAGVGVKRERPEEEAPASAGAGDAGGWSTMSVGGGAGAAAPAAAARRNAPAVDPSRAAATKKAFFSEGREEKKPRPGEWLVRERKGAMEAAAAAAASAEASGAPGATVAPLADRTAAFENERTEMLAQMPTSLKDAAGWPLQLEALNLGVRTTYNNLHNRIARYVSDVLPEDEEAIAQEVLQLVQKGKALTDVLDFCEFMGQEAEGFTLKVWRMLIAESEMQRLKTKYSLP